MPSCRREAAVAGLGCRRFGKRLRLVGRHVACTSATHSESNGAGRRELGGDLLGIRIQAHVEKGWCAGKTNKP